MRVLLSRPKGYIYFDSFIILKTLYYTFNAYVFWSFLNSGKVLDMIYEYYHLGLQVKFIY
jgi:hypothetical protein